MCVCVCVRLGRPAIPEYSFYSSQLFSDHFQKPPIPLAKLPLSIFIRLLLVLLPPEVRTTESSADRLSLLKGTVKPSVLPPQAMSVTFSGRGRRSFLRSGCWYLSTASPSARRWRERGQAGLRREAGERKWGQTQRQRRQSPLPRRGNESGRGSGVAEPGLSAHARRVNEDAAETCPHPGDVTALSRPPPPPRACPAAAHACSPPRAGRAAKCPSP